MLLPGKEEPGVMEAAQALGIEGFIIRGECNNEEQFLQAFRKITGVDANGTGIESSDPDDFGVTWSEIQTKLDELKAAHPLNELRRQRNALLAETDWMATSDRTMSAEQTAYRQALRDITDTYTSMDDEGFEWPTKPE